MKFEILIYLRRQDLHIPSHYQQAVNGTVTLSLNEWIEHAIDSGYYDYHSNIEDWKNYFEKSKFIIKPLHNLVNYDIRYDFIHSMSLNYEDFLFKKSQLLNESVDWHVIPILRCFNLCMLDSVNDTSIIKDVKSQFIAYTRLSSESQKLSLNAHQKRIVVASCLNSNQKLSETKDLPKESSEYFLDFEKSRSDNEINLDNISLLEFQLLEKFVKALFPRLSLDEKLLAAFAGIKSYKFNDDLNLYLYSINDLKEYLERIIQLYIECQVEMKQKENVYKPIYLTNNSLYFLHIAKCGGTSVKSFLNQLFTQGEFVQGLNPDMLSQFSKQEIAKWKLISGHLDRTVLSYIKPDYIITWLRDPIERLVSYYSRLTQLSIENREEFKENAKTEAIVKRFEQDTNYFRSDNPEFLRDSNLMTKSLGSNFFAYDRYITSGPEKLDEAKKYLEQNVSFFGVMNRIQESMDLMSYVLGQIPSQTHHHKNPTDPKFKDAYRTEEMLHFFEGASDLDIPLWSFATDLFNERFNRTMHYLWDKNNAYNNEVTPTSNFNDFDYGHIREDVIKFMRIEIECNPNIVFKDTLDYTFDLPIHGEGWSEREWFNDLTHYTLRWINQPKASIYFPLNRKNILECYVHIPHKVTELKNIFVDGSIVENIDYISVHNHSKDTEPGELLKFRIPVSTNTLQKLTKIEFEVTYVTSPNQLDNSNLDKQLKSISIDWIRISPLL